ncbi:MAG: tetratricopeptide repeat protein [Rhodospirillales bacterium]|nr:tetratricopeptide repeat protein [Rhodospirillales bacterium]
MVKNAAKNIKQKLHSEPSSRQETPSNVEQDFALAIQHHQNGQINDAVNIYRSILNVDGDHTPSLHNLGSIVMGGGNAEQAIVLFRKALSLKPDFARAHSSMGIALYQLGRLDDSLASLRQSLAINPSDQQVHFNLGIVLKGLNLPEEAIVSYREALRLNPKDINARINMGTVLLEERHHEEAAACFREALTVNPLTESAHFNLGNALQAMGNFDEAIVSFSKAIAINPDYVEGHLNLGYALKSQGQFLEAIDSYHKAIAIKPEYYEVYNSLGNALKDLGRHDEAIDSFNKALSLNPEYSEAYNNLGNVFKDLGRQDDAIDNYRKALSIKPDYAKAHSNLILTMQYMPTMTGGDLLKETLKWGKQHCIHDAVSSFNNTPDPERKLRVGYVSADFRMHAVSYLLEPLLAGHNRDQIELFCYAEVARTDQVSERFKNLSDHWRSSVGLDDEQLVALIRDDMIDILVDCTGHTANNRLLAFSRKPAPVLVNHYIMHGTTSGVGAMDYILSDPLITPPGFENQFSEKVEILPNGTFAFRPDPLWPEVAPPRQDPDGPLFACVGDPARICLQTVSLWSSLLVLVPGSRILFKHKAYDSPQAMEHWQAAFKELGGRALFENVVDGWGSNMDFYGRVDVVLDTLPMSGGTSSLIPLWMGVPVISMTGNYYCHRNGSSMISHAGMAELTTQNPEDYLRIACDLINDRQRLNSLRATLRETIKSSPAMDGQGRAADLEAAYRSMWRKWCKNA